MRDQLSLWNQKLNEDKKLTVWVSALATPLLLLVVFAWKGMYPFGKGSVMMVDLYSQYGPLLYRFYDVVTGHKNLFMDFDILAGSNLYADTINELINPFNYILFLFGRQNLYLALNILLLAYVSAMAGAATYVLNKFEDKQGALHLVLGIAYALSGYVAYNFQIIKWMYFPVLFPLFLLALVEMLQGKKGWKYCLLLAYQLALSIQLGYMTLLFSLFAGGMFVWFCVEKEERNKRLSRMGVWTLIAIGLSAFSLLPMVEVLLESARTGQTSSYFGVMKIHGLDDLFERIYQVAHPVLLGTLMLLIRKSYVQREKVGEMPALRRWLITLLAFLWITVLVQPSNLIWHLGSYFGFPVRYGYMVLFVNCLLIAVWRKSDAIPTMPAMTSEEGGTMDSESAAIPVSVNRARGKLLLALMLCFLAVGMTFFREEILTQGFSSLGISILCPKEALYAFVIMLLLGAATFLASRRLRVFMICIWGILTFVMNLLPPQAVIRGMNEYAYENMDYNSDTVKTDFVRVKEKNNEPLNAGLVTNIPTLSGYIPAGYGDYLQAMKDMGYKLQRVDLSSEGGSTVSDEVLNHAYVLKSEGRFRPEVNVEEIFKNGIEVSNIRMDARKATIQIDLSNIDDTTGIENGDVLFLPIASVSGWKLDSYEQLTIPADAKVYDTNMVQINGGFLGVVLSEHAKEVSLRYTAPGAIPGLLITLLFMLLMAVFLADKWMDKVPLAAVYKVLFWGGIVAFYLIPPIGLLLYMAGKIIGIIPR